MKRLFVTATDTDAGKTHVSCALLRAAGRRGLSSLGLKPVAAGCESTAAGWRNSDALALQAASTLQLPYDQVNPIALPEACAPHVAAARAGRRLTLDRLSGLVRGTMMQRTDVTLVEGAGGWRVPLNERELLSGLPLQLNLPVLLVVNLRLGCLNAALLTAEALRRDGVHLAGWVGNAAAGEMPFQAENVQALTHWLPCPAWGVFPHDPAVGEATRAAADAVLGAWLAA